MKNATRDHDGEMAPAPGSRNLHIAADRRKPPGSSWRPAFLELESRILAKRLGAQRNVKIEIVTRPQAGLADFYREMGDLFGVELASHNRWAEAKVLRDRWQTHIDAPAKALSRSAASTSNLRFDRESERLRRRNRPSNDRKRSAEPKPARTADGAGGGGSHLCARIAAV